MDTIERITELLEEKEWSKYELAKRSGIAQSTMSSLMTRKKTRPSASTLSKIAGALDVSVEYLLGETNKKKPTHELHESIMQFINLLTKNRPSRELESIAEEDIFNLINELTQKYKISFKINAVDQDRLSKIVDAILEKQNGELNVELLESVQKLAEKHKVWIDPKNNYFYMINGGDYNKKITDHRDFIIKDELDLIKNINLNDEEIKKQYKFDLDGKPLSEEEIDRLIVFLRTNRQFDQ